MITAASLCTICSTPLPVPVGNQNRNKLLQTPCQHVFHRNCLKTIFRRNPSVNLCPKCKKPVSWNEVRVWQETGKSSGGRKCKMESVNLGPSVPSLAEEIRRKNAEEIVKIRCSKKLGQALLDEVQRREFQEQKRISALQRQRAEIKYKKSSGSERRRNLTLLRIISSIFVLVLVVFSFWFVWKMWFSPSETIESMALYCYGKLKKTREMGKVTKSILTKLVEAQRIQNPDKNLLAKMQEDLEIVRKLHEQIELVNEDIKRVCIPKLKEKTEEIKEYFTTVTDGYMGNGLYSNEFHLSGNKLWMQQMQKSIMDNFSLE